MSEQPRALQLADELEKEGDSWFRERDEEAAAELRRLHALNAELLGLLKRAGVVINDTAYGGAVFRKEVRDVMDAIAKATGEQA